MPGKILGIDVQTDSITAVLLQGGFNSYTVTGCARVMIGEAGGLDEALATLGEHVDLKADTFMSAIPGEQVSFRNLRMPFKSAKKLRQTIAFALEETVPFSIDECTVDFTITDQSDQSEILVASVRRRYIADYLTSLKAHAMEPDVLDIGGVSVTLWLLREAGLPDNGLVFEIGSKNATMVLYLKRHISLIRTFSFTDCLAAPAFSSGQTVSSAKAPEDERFESCLEILCTNVRNTLHAFHYQNNREVSPEIAFVTGSGSLAPNTELLLKRFLDIPVEMINVTSDSRVRMEDDITTEWNPALMDSALSLALRGSREKLGFNFRKDEFEFRKKDVTPQKEIRRAAVFLLIILSLISAYGGVDYHFLKRRYRMLDRQIIEIFRTTVPEVKRIVDPVQQMRIKIEEIKKSTIALPGIGEKQRVLDLLREISFRVPESLDMRVTSMTVDPEAVQIKAETDTFNTVDSIKQGLEGTGYFSEITISSANLDRSGKRVGFDLRLKRAHE
ncbi:MAG: type II secretion system protein GspL [Pseudomonadota bacterium]